MSTRFVPHLQADLLGPARRVFVLVMQTSDYHQVLLHIWQNSCSNKFRTVSHKLRSPYYSMSISSEAWSHLSSEHKLSRHRSRSPNPTPKIPSLRDQKRLSPQLLYVGEQIKEPYPPPNPIKQPDARGLPPPRDIASFMEPPRKSTEAHPIASRNSNPGVGMIGVIGNVDCIAI
ncbi:hypothetical protein BJ508DRAFT_328451 [Ascobolus immersus RN42]|uniref:Uncharacterized protein n=1 Tax=Ascobolus immersus RN42 TaxID=1160509 RepID=A0A3N4I3X0_ASCIM|nr:hypothetical protein BJ508DRAFT_328451 [Ascobolus immersus RN42]